MVPDRDGVGLPKLSGISAELFARLRGPGESGPLSRECAKLQAYLPAISECLEKRLLPDNKPAYDTVLFLVDVMCDDSAPLQDWAPVHKSTIDHNVDPFGKIGYSRSHVKASLESFRQAIAAGAHFGCQRCNEFLSHADMTNIKTPANLREITSGGRVVQGYD